MRTASSEAHVIVDVIVVDPGAWRVVGFGAVLLALFAPSTALAHDFLPGVLALEEIEANVYRFAWTPPVDSGQSMPVQIAFPPECIVTGDVAACPSGEPKIEFSGLGDQRVLISVMHRDGRREETAVPGSRPSGLALLRAAIAISLLLVARRSLRRFPRWTHPLAYALGAFAFYLLIAILA